MLHACLGQHDWGKPAKWIYYINIGFISMTIKLISDSLVLLKIFEVVA